MLTDGGFDKDLMEYINRKDPQPKNDYVCDGVYTWKWF
jgi:hypothetical protein